MCEGGADGEKCRHPHQAGTGGWKTDLFRKKTCGRKSAGHGGIVLDSSGGMHGVGLMNVKAVVDKYGGGFAISCDEEKFQAAVMM